MEGWLEKWIPMAVEASEQLQPIWSQPRVKRIPYADVYEQSKERMVTALSEINLAVPSGVRV